MSTVKLAMTNGEEKLRKVWRQMRRRCTITTDPKFQIYGARGIAVCPEWRTYEAFRSWAIEAGYAEGLTIDRIDFDGNYEPSNCRWITMDEQARNRRTNQRITAFGETKTLVEWFEDPRCVVSYAAAYLRIFRRKWDAERALTTPEILNNEKATHCPQGHEYTPDNICWDGPEHKWRKCATCNRERARRNYLKRRQNVQ